MKLVSALGALGGVALATFGGEPVEPYVFILSGDTHGYLSPCGCTKPMSGGIRRRATAVRRLSAPGRTIVLENGGMIDGTGRQDVMKAETLAESLREMGVTAVNLTPSEARLGPGLALAISSLSDGRLTTASLAPSPTNQIPAWIAQGPFLIGGVTAMPEDLAGPLRERALGAEAATARLVAEAEASDLLPVLMLNGDRKLAEQLATRFPSLRLVQYSLHGDAPRQPALIGQTVLATSGETGKALVRISFREGKFDGYERIALTPDFADDPAVSRIYKTYLLRVEQEGLLDKLARVPSKAFAGNAVCSKCHSSAAKVWKTSAHARALTTLEKDGHSKDPDCVGCHVVGLEQKTGFRSREKTPQLAHVGCESCHGPGAEHARRPGSFRMGKAGPKSCLSCHRPSASPNFSFAAYWAKIKH